MKTKIKKKEIEYVEKLPENILNIGNLYLSSNTTDIKQLIVFAKMIMSDDILKKYLEHNFVNKKMGR